MTILYTNNARSTLAAGISAGDTALTVATGHGDRFPVVVAPDIAYITLENTGGIREIIKCTARASGSDVLTIVRAQNGTSAAAWIAGDTVAHRVIALELGRYETLGNVDDADSKATPVDADYVPLKDSAASNGLKKLTWENIKATLKTYFDTLYAKVGAITGGGITMTAARLLGRTTAGTGAVEEITVGTGLSLAAGALTCTVTSDVNSVAGETGVITAAELIAALNAEGGLDSDSLGGVAAASFSQTSHTHTGAYVAADQGANSVGSLAIGIANLYSSPPAVGTTYAGGAGGVSLWATGTTLSGTWRCLSAFTSGVDLDHPDGSYYQGGLFQRIA